MFVPARAGRPAPPRPAPRCRTPRAVAHAAAATALLAVAPAGAHAAGAVEPINDLETNWSFESNLGAPAGWDTYDGTASAAAESNAPDGANAVTVTCTAGTAACRDPGYAFDDLNPVANSVKGATYTGSVWVKGAVNDKGSTIGTVATLKIRTATPSDPPASRDVVLSSDWQRVSVSLKAQKSGEPVDMYVAKSGPKNVDGEAFLVDAATRTSSAPAPAPAGPAASRSRAAA